MTPPTATAAPAAAPERPVFAAATSARPRTLKVMGRVAAGLVALWLVALVLGAFGFSQVAGIPLPRIGGAGNEGEAARKAPPAAAEPARRARVTLTTRHAGTRVTPYGLRHGATGRSNPSSRPGVSRPRSRGTSTSSTPTSTPSSPGSTPSPSTAAPSTSSAPAGTGAPSTSPSHSSYSQGSPPRSSSSAPGSRSQASTAPGRTQSSASPSPGSGKAEHAPPKG